MFIFEILTLVFAVFALIYSVFSMKKTSAGECFYISKPDIVTLFLYGKYPNLRTVHLRKNTFTKRKLAREWRRICKCVVSAGNATFTAVTTDFFAQKITRDRRVEVLFFRAKSAGKLWTKMFGTDAKNAVRIIFRIVKKEEL